MAKLYKFLAFFSFTALFAILMRAALVPDLPSKQNPIVFYSNQKRDDLRLVLKKLFSEAQSSIFMMMYGANDEKLLKILGKVTKNGVHTRLYHDRSNPIKADFARPIKSKGLMHRKIVVIDDTISLIGSANMTTSSLLMHDNLSIGFYHPPLAKFLQDPQNTHLDFKVDQQTVKLWLLPDPQALVFLQQQLEQAAHSIFVAMFTLTHPTLIETLIKVHEKGIAVTVAIDHYAAKGASKKAVKQLQSKGVRVIFSQGQHLLHHKWAYIDRRQLAIGSTNWTRAAFTKNQDTLLFFDHLDQKKQNIMNQLCRTIELESKKQL